MQPSKDTSIGRTIKFHKEVEMDKFSLKQKKNSVLRYS